MKGSGKEKVSKMLFFAFCVNTKFQETKIICYSRPSEVSHLRMQLKAVRSNVG